MRKELRRWPTQMAIEIFPERIAGAHQGIRKMEMRAQPERIQ